MSLLYIYTFTFKSSSLSLSVSWFTFDVFLHLYICLCFCISTRLCTIFQSFSMSFILYFLLPLFLYLSLPFSLSQHTFAFSLNLFYLFLHFSFLYIILYLQCPYSTVHISLQLLHSINYIFRRPFLFIFTPYFYPSLSHFILHFASVFLSSSFSCQHLNVVSLKREIEVSIMFTFIRFASMLTWLWSVIIFSCFKIEKNLPCNVKSIRCSLLRCYGKKTRSKNRHMFSE